VIDEIEGQLSSANPIEAGELLSVSVDVLPSHGPSPFSPRLNSSLFMNCWS
jgi:hypothetical protein